MVSGAIDSVLETKPGNIIDETPSFKPKGEKKYYTRRQAQSIWNSNVNVKFLS
jgi:hypothetical protein